MNPPSLYRLERASRMNPAVCKPRPVVPDTVRGLYFKGLNRVGAFARDPVAKRIRLETARFIRVNIGLGRLP